MEFSLLVEYSFTLLYLFNLKEMVVTYKICKTIIFGEH